MPEHQFLLTISSIVILIRDLHVRMKDVNGTRDIITALSSNLISAKTWEVMMMNLHCSFRKLSISLKMMNFLSL